MLVVLCAIRKVLEFIFTKRELRLLDDLLPEVGKGRRREGMKKTKVHPDQQAERGHWHSENLDSDEHYPSRKRLMLKYEGPTSSQGKGKSRRTERDLDFELQVRTA